MIKVSPAISSLNLPSSSYSAEMSLGVSLPTSVPSPSLPGLAQDPFFSKTSPYAPCFQANPQTSSRVPPLPRCLRTPLALPTPDSLSLAPGPQASPGILPPAGPAQDIMAIQAHPPQLPFPVLGAKGRADGGWGADANVSFLSAEILWSLIHG